MDCIFCKIAQKQIHSKIVYEDENVVVFPDIHPVKKIHLLIIPKKHISEFIALENTELMKDISNVLQKLIHDNKLENTGYKIVINGGGAQVVDHLHIHLMGPMGKHVSE